MIKKAKQQKNRRSAEGLQHSRLVVKSFQQKKNVNTRKSLLPVFSGSKVGSVLCAYIFLFLKGLENLKGLAKRAICVRPEKELSLSFLAGQQISERERPKIG